MFDLLTPKLRHQHFPQTTKCKCFSRNFLKRFGLELIDLKKTEVYFLRGFNVNLLVNKFFLKENQSLDFRNLNSRLMSRYK